MEIDISRSYQVRNTMLYVCEPVLEWPIFSFVLAGRKSNAPSAPHMQGVSAGLMSMSAPRSIVYEV